MSEALPSAVRAALQARGAQAPAEWLPTEREAPLPTLDGSERSALMYVVRCPGQLWLVAASEATSPAGLADAVAVATGDPDRVELQRSFGRLALVVDGVRASLDPELRATAHALLARFVDARGGPNYEFDARLGARASDAGEPRWEVGAYELQGWLRAVGGSDGWLLAQSTRTETWIAGKVRDLKHELALGMGRAGPALAALGSTRPSIVPLETLAEPARNLAFPRISGPGFRVDGGLLDGPGFLRAHRLARVAPEERSFELAALRLEEGQLEAALAIARACAKAGRPMGAALRAAFATRIGDFETAFAALESLSVDDLGWVETLRSRARGLTPEALAPLVVRATPGAPIPGFPWPPQSLEEAWAAALVARGDVDAAQVFSERIHAPERRARIRLALELTPLRARLEDALRASSPEELEACADALAQLEPPAEAGPFSVETFDLPRPGSLYLDAAETWPDPERAAQAAWRGVRVDFLHAETVARAAALDVLPDADRRWLRHLATVLEPGPVAPPEREGAGSISKARLSELALPESGWLGELEARWAKANLPARDQLTRGLERVEQTTRPELFEDVRELSHALGLDPVPTYIFRGDDAIGISSWPHGPPVILVGEQHLTAGPRQLDRTARRFALAVELAHLAAGHPVLAFDGSLAASGRNAYQAFGRFAGSAEMAVDLLTLIPGVDQLAKLQKIIAMSRRVFLARKTVDKAQSLTAPLWSRLRPRAPKPSRGVSHPRVAGAALRMRRQADRAALLLVPDLEAATRAILATGSEPSARLDRVETDGLAALLAEQPPGTLTTDELLRLAGLLEDAALDGSESSAA